MDAIEPLLSDASVAVGRLDGLSDFVPNPDWFMYMYIRKEAVLSSRIEGTQTSLSGLLEFEAGREAAGSEKDDVGEVVNYVRALNGCVEGLAERGLSVGLIEAGHLELMQGVRGENKSPGMMRREQNWISRGGRPPGVGLDVHDVIYAPPPHEIVPRAMRNLETYLTRRDIPALVQAGIAHAQFETIHPFLDGNGRLGRLLVALLLAERKVLRRPLLYISAYFVHYRSEYYDWLTAVRETGDWEGWLRFFLNGVNEVANEACGVARSLVNMQNETRRMLKSRYPGRRSAHQLIEVLFEHPIVTVKQIAQELGIDITTANAAVLDLCDAGVLVEVTGRKRDRVFRYNQYLDLLEGSAASDR